jgi:glycosyltransferase involved in cell wall biosynthesis
MKILMCNTYYYLRGGSERCLFDLSELLVSHGHEVIPFSMVDDQNRPSPYSDYFVSHIDYPSRLSQESSMGDKLNALGRVVYSREAAGQIKRLIQDTRPDIAHIHGIAHEISPSILPEIKRAGLPIVQTLHDYKLLCPNTTFLSHGEICEKCKYRRYYQVVLNRCKRDSLPASLLAGVEMYAHKISAIYENNVDRFIAPSEFLNEKLAEYRIHVPTVNIPNFLYLDRYEPCYEPEDYFLYIGRLAVNKGIKTLLQAMQQVNRSHLYIAGRGELKEELKAFVEDNDLHNVTFLGHLTSDELISQLRKARFTVVPSEWYENYSMAIIESLACGTPVIGANIGGIPEQVVDGFNGFLFEPGKAAQLAEKINYLLDNPQRTVELGRNGRRRVEELNGPEKHYQQTLAVYESVLNKTAYVTADNA